MIESIALIDWIAITLVSVFGITGFFNGFVKELFSAAAWIVSLALAWLFGPLLFPYVQDFIEVDTIKNIISFILFFLISFIFNLNYLDKNQWWLDSYSRVYSIQFYDYSKPVFDEWMNRADIILQKDDSK